MRTVRYVTDHSLETAHTPARVDFSMSILWVPVRAPVQRWPARNWPSGMASISARDGAAMDAERWSLEGPLGTQSAALLTFFTARWRSPRGTSLLAFQQPCRRKFPRADDAAAANV